MSIGITSFAQIDTDLQPFYDSFLSDANSRDVTLDLSYTLKMKFSASKINYRGVSITDSENASFLILFRKEVWDTLTVTERKILVYHELGHTLLHRKHQEYNLSLMNSVLVSESTYLTNENDLLDELFMPYGDTYSNFKAPIGTPSGSVSFRTGDLVFVSQGYGYPLKSFFVNVQDDSNEIYLLRNYTSYFFSVIDLRDKSKMIIKNGRLIQIRSTYGGVSLVQPNPLYQPYWSESQQKVLFLGDTYLEYNVDCLNSYFDPVPFGNYGTSSLLSGLIRISGNEDLYTGKIIVVFYEKPYISNYE